jgi:hypothetical protein
VSVFRFNLFGIMLALFLRLFAMAVAGVNCWQYSLLNRWQKRRMHRRVRNQIARLRTLEHKHGVYVLNAKGGGGGGAPPPGAYYGLPGYTSWTEQKENNDAAVVTLQAGTQVPFSAVVPFKTTDVVLWWELEVTWANTMAVGSGVINTSPYFPFNVVGPSKLQIQNQYPAFDIQSGIDAALLQIFRPSRATDYETLMGASADGWWPNMLPGRLSTATVGGGTQLQPALDAELASPNVFAFQSSLTPASVPSVTAPEQTFTSYFGLVAGDIALGVNTGATAQTPGVTIGEVRVSAANTLVIQFVNPTAGAVVPVAGTYTVTVLRIADLPTTASIHFTLELPGGIYFDDYYDLSKDGAMVSQPHRAFVSPTFMASTARSVQPDFKFNPGFAANLDSGPFFQQSAGTSSFTGSTVTMGWRRIGVYGANNPAYMPVVYNWQLVRQAKNISLSGVPQKDIPIQFWGQILLLILRFFDPNIANGGGPIDLNANISKAQLQYGSGLLRFDDTARSAQRRIIKHHGVLPPPGVIAWDLAIDDQGRLTNRRALNTLTTAGVNVHLEFVGALSVTAYMVLIAEYLAYVE